MGPPVEWRRWVQACAAQDQALLPLGTACLHPMNATPVLVPVACGCASLDDTGRQVTQGGWGRPPKSRLLLKDVTAGARHGEILAVVGPSGAGKSTFLDAVAGRISGSNLRGHILVNGRPADSSFRRHSGYVATAEQLPAPCSPAHCSALPAALVPGEWAYAVRCQNRGSPRCLCLGTWWGVQVRDAG